MLSDVLKDLKEIPNVHVLKRLRDEKPFHCSLYVTDRCNLSCGYCTEFDNTRPHPDLDSIIRRIDKIADLGVMKLSLSGGEPLLHPEIEQIIRHAKSRRLNVSLSTNGILLTKDMLFRLERAGLDLLQISLDRKTPSRMTQKALDTLPLSPEVLGKSDIKIHISGVICQNTIEEAEKVLDFGLSHDIPTEVRLMHGDQSGQTRIASSRIKDGLRLIGLQRKLKRQGKRIHSSAMLLSYQKNRLLGKDMPWTCLAGYKIFFVSTEGHFWPCSLLKTNRKIEDITLQDLKAYKRVKECQPSCGIYCSISNSIFFQSPFRFILGEIPSKLRQYMRIMWKNQSKSVQIAGNQAG